MSNVFRNTALVARDAAILLRNSLKAAMTIPGDVQQKFAQKVGEEVEVKVRPVMAANRHYGSGAFSNSDITESSAKIRIGHRSYIKHRLTAIEKTFKLDDFSLTVVQPAMLAIAQDIDLYLTHSVLAPGFARGLVGTDGNQASTLAHIAAAWKKLFDNGNSGRMTGLLTSTTAASFLQLQQLTSRDYQDNLGTVAKALFNPVYDIDFFPVQNASAIARGDVGGTITLAADAAAGATAISITGVTSVTGYTRHGTRFTLAGDSTVYTIEPNTTAITPSANAGVWDYAVAAPMTVNVYPALAAAHTTGDVLTPKAAAVENVIFNPNAVGKAIIAPMPQVGNPSSVESFEGVSVRVTYESTINDSTDGDAEYVLFDVFVGGRVFVPQAGAVMQG